MAYMVLKSASFLALVVFVFAVISTTTTPVEGICERASQTWSGSCRNTGGCNNQCKTWEKARNGACHTRNGKKMCFCYFNTCSAARLCERASQTWSGSCRNTQGCDRQCKNWEDAAHGACHTRNGKKMCFCYFGRNC
ncbi:hypothetical protein C5167_035789 [Papaver somniferum]|uniref:defensin-like protein 19 n=1 Tax=Papaver somniferum TaxID=3469 RepID=UPI000E700E2E|nr:defensin-like protein 19 [Papaver somniferum]RZC89794.1 hypothetical protein C5167_035789 [Papaver somniferum]